MPIGYLLLLLNIAVLMTLRAPDVFVFPPKYTILSIAALAPENEH